MAGAKLDFGNGSLGFERCVDPADDKQFLRAVIHHNATGRTTSAAVSIDDAATFVSEAMKQICLCRLNTTDDNALVDSDMAMEQQVREAVARGWCHEKNSHKEMDVDLANAIVDEVVKSITPEKMPGHR